jgi:hypothetical protein
MILEMLIKCLTSVALSSRCRRNFGDADVICADAESSLGTVLKPAPTPRRNKGAAKGESPGNRQPPVHQSLEEISMIRMTLAAAAAAFLLAAPAMADNTMAGGAMSAKPAATADCKGSAMASGHTNTMAGGNSMSGGNTMAGGNSMSGGNAMSGGAKKPDCKPAKPANSMTGGAGH